MTIEQQEQLPSGMALREIAQQTTASLVRLDARHLDELAQRCADLNRELHETGGIVEAAATLQETRRDVELLGRVLNETRANIAVLSRLQMSRYKKAIETTIGWKLQERTAEYGDN